MAGRRARSALAARRAAPGWIRAWPRPAAPGASGRSRRPCICSGSLRPARSGAAGRPPCPAVAPGWRRSWSRRRVPPSRRGRGTGAGARGARRIRPPARVRPTATSSRSGSRRPCCCRNSPALPARRCALHAFADLGQVEPGRRRARCGSGMVSNSGTTRVVVLDRRAGRRDQAGFLLQHHHFQQVAQRLGVGHDGLAHRLLAVARPAGRGGGAARPARGWCRCTRSTARPAGAPAPARRAAAPRARPRPAPGSPAAGLGIACRRG